MRNGQKIYYPSLEDGQWIVDADQWNSQDEILLIWLRDGLIFTNKRDCEKECKELNKDIS